ncbi:hypothetical protein FIBSPDRAFT_827966 [Athelia psychrophila]|uniref:DAGKc domain-containing protein n=1 Tax=Athelia psychrophila TaxID=1759441 RepID=A0A166I1E5_9AGAM|nr:hypothetical protein FIBSPDRAFT_827966 [Fibularhizoctonia sp. CBS 109695]
MAAAVQTFDLTVTSSGKAVRLRLTTTALFVSRQDKREAEVPVRQVIGAYHASNTLELYYLARKSAKSQLALSKIEGTADEAQTKAWCEAMMDIAYQGVKPYRRLKVLINPFGGKGRAGALYNKVVEPIFRAAKCPMDATYTTHSKHAVEIASTLDFVYDALVVVSGDGLMHEVMNGFAQHPQSARAFELPVALVPGGSANATSLNILGTKDGVDCAAAALNAIKGKPMKVDLFLLTQGGKTTISTMTQALGIMADCDLGTESWRWMGEARFVLGFLRGLVAFKTCPLVVQIKVAEQDKARMVQALESSKASSPAGPQGQGQLQSPTSPSCDAGSACKAAAEGSLPDLAQPVDQMDGWLTFDKPAVYLYAGKGPFVARDLMQFPVSVPDDGYVDIVVQERRTRLEMISGIEGAASGAQFWLESKHYFKATAYRVKCLETRGYFAVDGESYPFTDFQVEVLKGLGTLLSPYGHYAEDLSRSKRMTKGL